MTRAKGWLRGAETVIVVAAIVVILVAYVIAKLATP